MSKAGETLTYVFLLGGAATTVGIVVPRIMSSSKDIHDQLSALNTPSAPPGPPSNPSPPFHPPPLPRTPPSAPPPTSGRRLANIVTTMKKPAGAASTYQLTHEERSQLGL